MKKLRTIFAAALVGLMMVACGGPDLQPAIDAHTRLTENYNKFVEYANADLESYSQEDIDTMNSCADILNEYAVKLTDGTEFTQEEIDYLVEVFDDFNADIEAYLANYENQ